MIKLTYYEVYDNYSEDGSAPYGDAVIGRFSSYSDASVYAEGRGNWGRAASIRTKNLSITESLQEIDEYKIPNH